MTLDTPLTVSKVNTMLDINVYYMDDPYSRVVKAFVRGYTNTPIVMWAGDTYDAIGDWTSEQAEARLNELHAAGVIAATLSA